MPRISVLLLLVLVVGPNLPSAPARADNLPAPSPTMAELPLLRWDVLTTTVYDPRYPIEWPRAVEAMNGSRVRMEGYLMPRYDSQDPEDLYLTGINPVNLFCGPTDLTLVVELYMPGFKYDLWPALPVEITGTFHLSRRTNDYRPIYLFLGESWRPLRRWVQPFPGTVQIDRDELDTDDLSQ